MKIKIKSPKIEFEFDDEKTNGGGSGEYSSKWLLPMIIAIMQKVSEDTEKLKNIY